MGVYSRSQEVIDIYDDDISFLKSLKERIQSQPKQKWTEEDERIYKAIIMALLFDDTKGYLTSLYITPEEANNWIKSIKDRYAWKPSDVQMEALDIAIDEIHSMKTTAGDEVANALSSLYEQLKALV